MFPYKYKKLQYNYISFFLKTVKISARFVTFWIMNDKTNYPNFFQFYFQTIFFLSNLNVRTYFFNKLFNWAVLSCGTVDYALRRGD